MADKPDSKPFDLEANQDEIALFELREEVRKILPPVSEIAQLAALISHGHPIGLQTWETYAGHAIYLWEVSFQKREDWIAKQAHMKLLRRKAEAKEAEEKFPMPKKYPVGLDDFLKFALPKKRPENRMKLYRESIRVSIRHSRCFQPSGNVIPFESIPIPTDDEVAATIAHHRATGFDEFQYRHCVGALQNFAAWDEKQNLKKRAQSGAAGKWKENPPKK
ncbi:MAG TPA: hypothetical protein VK769_07390 [Verrucomicrobiae bacterium]|jgi:hypothetical protein|nr:hypothetical protein [Verrucomicrobiae bacterium]